MRRMAKLESPVRESSLAARAAAAALVAAASRSRRNRTAVAFLVSSKTRESLVSMRKQPDHWWTQPRSRSERRQPSPESQRQRQNNQTFISSRGRA